MLPELFVMACNLVLTKAIVKQTTPPTCTIAVTLAVTPNREGTP
jgi:hypothetical protein